MTKIFEQFKYKGMLITIENYYNTDELYGFACPIKYSHLLNLSNYDYIDEIAEENGIGKFTDEDGDIYYKDFWYVIADPTDVVVYFLERVKVTSVKSVLKYMKKQIKNAITPETKIVNVLGEDVREYRKKMKQLAEIYYNHIDKNGL